MNCKAMETTNEKAVARDLAQHQRWYVLLLTAAGLLSSSSMAMGQMPPWLDPGLEREAVAHLQAKYALREQLSGRYRVESVHVDTSDRAQGIISRHLRLSGDFTPETPVTPEPGKHGKELALARAFLEQEAMALFNLEPADIRLEKVFDERPDTAMKAFLRYAVYVGDFPLAGAGVRMSFDLNDRLTRVYADLLPISVELREAVKRPILDERAIERVVLRHLEAEAKNPTVPYPVQEYFKHPLWSSLKKVAIPTPPYVVVDVDGPWHYEVNAFTGEILEAFFQAIVW